ncbi:aspartate kinase [Desertivirga brevis]|uniref:aspartate kinase n=1 Tax=Desertivirga brevis TaxID=2810310 RepID=UPI001A95BB1A|nr:aspartate kinase [Pedobacter sp. SYSU D00873]
MAEVFKFGGASVKDAEGIRNLAQIIRLNTGKQLLVVISAMGKTTNALEDLTYAYVNQQENMHEIFERIKEYHEAIMLHLFGSANHPVFDDIANSFVEIDWILEEEPHDDYDYIYDQIVSLGELVSTKIVSAYLGSIGIENIWLDARSFIHTDNTYREGQVNWNKTTSAIQSQVPGIIEERVAITQGFIGGTSENFTATLGREGSDYTAAIFASCLGAEAVTIWKDVPGVLNADPKLFSDTVKYEELSYRDALEMTYYGATVIHPKTIKPLQNSKIPLFVKPFLAPEEQGTKITESNIIITEPAIIIKKDQILLTISSKDLAFITEEHLCEIYGIFAKAHVKTNTMQLSAISFSAGFDWDERKFHKLKALLERNYTFRYNEGLTLITVRHYKSEMLRKLSEGKTVLLEQLSRHTAQMVVKTV